MKKIVIVGLFLWSVWLSYRIDKLQVKIDTVGQYLLQQQSDTGDDDLSPDNTGHL